MGCDIHMHFETLVDDEWFHYSQPDFGRNYQIFSKMAGVRGQEEPIALPRGLPEDATKATRFSYECDAPDAHSASYLSSEEVIKLFEFIIKSNEYEENSFYMEDNWGYLYGRGWEYFHKYKEDYPKSLQDFRLVFWFDS